MRQSFEAPPRFLEDPLALRALARQPTAGTGARRHGMSLGRLTMALADRYRIERELGAGGMANVYLAHDVRHDRRVALKVLRPELAAVIGAERFLHEIKTTANLQHPHILGLLDSGEIDGLLWYVMPYVEGESLRDRLTREKQLPIDDAVRYAREVASALDYAHRHGVIHRDIKPENVLLHDGSALVADFGIALAVTSAGGHRMTETGMSLGTPAYMSPEQAMGERTLDARTDVYALGCVTYEMLVGEPPFTGPTAQAIVAKVLTERPPLATAARETVPEHVAAAIHKALSKLPADRFGTAAEFAAALVNPAFSSPGTATRSAPRVLPSAWKERLALPMSVLAVLALGLGAWGWLRPQTPPPVTRMYVGQPDAEALLPNWYAYAISNDGNTIAYIGRSETGRQLWVKRRSELHATALAGTDNASNPFFSPDGNWIGYIADGKLKKIQVTGGGAVTLADANCARLGCTGATFESGAWLDDGRIAFQALGTIVIMPESGGAIDTLVKSVDVLGLGVMLPVALPGARGILFNACTLACNKSDVWVVDLRTGQVRRLLTDATFPRYSATGHLLYSDRKGTALAAPFDLASLELRGAGVPVLDRVAGNIVVSASGTLLYLEGDEAPRSELVLVSRDGKATSIDSTWRGNFATLDLSPDGRRIAASIFSEGQEYILTKPIEGGQPSRLTFDRGQSTTPTWSFDGRSVMYTLFRGDTARFMTKRADGTGDATELRFGHGMVVESVASTDGRWLAIRNYQDGARDIYAMKTDGDTTARAVVATPTDDYSPAISPDGNWLAYVSEQTGRQEVWVSPFPDPRGSKWQVSTNGGWEPLWSRSGKEIFFVTAARELVVVDIMTTPQVTIGRPRSLFSVEGFRRHPTHRAYDVTPDDQRFLMIRSGPASAGVLVMVDNWFGELKAKVSR